MRQLLFAAVLLPGVALANLYVCHAAGGACPVLHTCPCPDVDGTPTGPCTPISPQVVCGEEYSPGHFWCDDAISASLFVYDCTPPTCKSKDGCKEGVWDRPPANSITIDDAGLAQGPTATCNAANEVAACLKGQPNQCLGDPLVSLSGSSYHEVEDVRLPGTVADLRLVRRFTSLPETNAWKLAMTGVAKPFGSVPGNALQAYWTHNFFAGLSVVGDGGIEVRDVDGRAHSFLACAAPCYAAPQGTSEQSARMYWDGTTYVLLHADGRRYAYGLVLGEWRLVRIEDAQYPASGELARVLASLSYTASPCAGAALLDGGAPVALDRVTSLEGVELRFHYVAMANTDVAPGANGLFHEPTPTTECVLASVGVKPPAGTEETAATYSYTGPGLVGTVTWGADGGRGTETYAVGPGTWSVSRNGVTETTHASTGGAGATDKTYGQQPLFVLSAGAGTSHQTWDEYLPSGTGASNVRFSNARTVDTADFGNGRWRLSSQTQACRTGECASGYPYSMQWNYGLFENEPRMTSAVNMRGGYTAYTWATSAASLATPLNPYELQSVARGANDASGAGALESTSYTYSYGGVGQPTRDYRQLTTQETTASVLQSGGQARTVRVFDTATNRLKALFQTGYTRAFDSAPATPTWTIAARTLGTFFFTQRKCGDQASDAFGRTLEVHGPCLVADTSATDCPAGAVFPVTQAFYFGATGTADAHRLQLLRKWTGVTNPTACSGTSLDTTYAGYDAFGNASLVIDANGVATTRVFSDDRLLSETTAGKTTSYTWERGVLVAVQRPEGNFEVSCYRAVALGTACVSPAVWTGRLQWKARAPNIDGTGFTEGLAWTYYPDGRVKTEEAWDTTGRRRQATLDDDGRGHEVFRRQGSGSSPVHLPHRYDPEGHLTGVGTGVSSITTCSSVNALGVGDGTECGSLVYDKADRLVTADVTGGTTRSCFTHDGQGNTTSVQTGCARSTTVADCGGCGQPVTTYQYDDFHNLVAMTVPGGGTTSMAYGALGNQTRKQTPTMSANKEWQESDFDGLGRLTATRHAWKTPSAGANTLFSLAYDDSGTLDASCPQPQRTMGRVRYRSDTFGKTWMQYDAWGRTVGEVRLRNGTTACTGALPRNVPHTFYTYSDNGNLLTMTYPYGRVVTYGYGLAAGKTTDRVASITVKLYNGSAWTDWLAVEKVAWEPYGGLRAWQANPSTTPAQPISVEYMHASNPQYPPSTTCPLSKPTTDDDSGRVQMTWVSRGALTLGGGAGDVFHRYVSFNNLLPSTTYTCWMGSTQASMIDSLGFTQDGQLTQSFTGLDSLPSLLVNAYDARGNRLQAAVTTSAAVRDTYTYADAGLDRLEAVQLAGASRVTRTYDADGRTRTLSWPNDSSGQPAWQQTWTPDSEGSTGRGGNDTVYRAVSVNGSVYGYYYDSRNRRRLKQYPTGTTDELFYDEGARLLVDRGNATVSSPSYFVTDEYVWLGEVPVAVVRGRLNKTTDARSADSTAACNRNGETAACGARHVISDTLPKPVVVVDKAGKVTALNAWDSFGDVDQVGIRNADTAHPYGNHTTQYLYQFYPGNAGRTIPTGTALDYRFTFDWVDTEGTSALPIDGVVVTNNYAAQGAKVGGYHRGRVTTPWYVSDGGVVMLTFTSDGRNCPPNQCLDGGNPTDGGAFPYAGVSPTRVEFRRRQSTAVAFTVPLRFPGQYFDAETGMVENWNRFYDPSTGRYLSPEPMLQDPNWVKHEAAAGFTTPTYAYARNNPLRYTDPTGLWAGWLRFFAIRLLPPFLTGAGVGFGASMAMPAGIPSGAEGGTGQDPVTTDPGIDPASAPVAVGAGVCGPGSPIDRCRREQDEWIAWCFDWLNDRKNMRPSLAKYICVQCTKNIFLECVSGPNAGTPENAEYCEFLMNKYAN